MKTRLIVFVTLFLITVAYGQEPNPRSPGQGQRGGGRGRGGAIAVAPWRLKWEYSVLDVSAIKKRGSGDLQAGLNKLGEEGWELIAVPAAEYYFKRATSPALTGMIGGSSGGVASPAAMGMIGGGSGGFDADQMFDRLSGGKDAITRQDLEARMPGRFDQLAERWGLKGDRITRSEYVNAVQKRLAGGRGGIGGGFGGAAAVRPDAGTTARQRPAATDTASAGTGIRTVVADNQTFYVITVKHADASVLAQLFQNLFRDATILSDQRTNCLIASGTEGQLKAIRDFLMELDKATPLPEGQ